MTQSVPFWKSKQLEEMTLAEWESLCDGCGRCCVFKVREVEGSPLHWTAVGCTLLDCETGHCKDYPNRVQKVFDCFQMTPEIVRTQDILPPSCGYRRVKEGRDLAWWHPLISGTNETVYQAGISVRGRIVPPEQAGDVIDHIVDWQEYPPTGRDDLLPRERALFAGANAELPTAFTAALTVDTRRMAAQALWLLRNGCSGLVLFGDAGEGQSLGVSERLTVLESLVDAGVPVSKLLPVTGTANLNDTILLTREAEAVGCRGVLLPPPFYYKGCAEAGTIEWFDTVARRVGGRTRLYVDLAPETTGVPISVEGLATLFDRHAGRIAGLRLSGALRGEARAITHRFAPALVEVYAGSPEVLADVMDAGGSGCMFGLAAIAPRLLSRICDLAHAPGTPADHAKVQALASAMAEYPVAAVVKHLLARLSDDPEWLRMRPPLEPLPEGWDHQGLAITAIEGRRVLVARK